MPMVKQQVESQIKVRDFSKLAVTLAPADYESWHVARTETMAEAKAGLKAKLEAELSAAADESELQGLRDRYRACLLRLSHLSAQHGTLCHSGSVVRSANWSTRSVRAMGKEAPSTRPPLLFLA